MDKKKVVIYVLVDPVTLKVRYIGRTSIKYLNSRLCQHINKAKNFKDNTHKSNWIRSLLKINSKPYIRQIAVVEGWAASYEFEKQLIYKYKDRLINHNDRGEGGKNVIITEERKLRIANTLKAYYKVNQIKTMTEVHVYDYDGTYIETYPSIQQAAKKTGIYHGTISKHLCGVSKHPKNIRKQFSYTRVDHMKDYTKT